MDASLSRSMDQYLPILFLVVLSLVFAVGSFVASRDARRPTAGSTRPRSAHTSPGSPPAAGRRRASRCGSTWWR